MVRVVKEFEIMKVLAEEESIAYQSKMLSAIPWLLPFEWKSGKELRYQKGKGQSLTEWVREERTEEEIFDILEAFFKNWKEVEAYLIDEDKVIWDPNWIFWDQESKILRFVYIPWDSSGGKQFSFMKHLARLLGAAAVQGKWQNERLILMLYRMQIAVKYQDQPECWEQWIKQEKRKITESNRIKEQALDILTEESEDLSKGWIQRMLAKFPFAVR